MKYLDSQRRGGAVLVLVLFCITVILIFSAYTINIAKMQSVRVELQAANDSAALAAAEAYARLDSVEEAIEAAKAVAQMNTVNGVPFELEDSDIQFGGSVENASGGFDFVPGQTPYDSVRITKQVTMPLFLDNVTGVGSFSPRSVVETRFAGHDICLCIDRSGSMMFDFSGVSGRMPNGQYYTRSHSFWYEPPHPSLSRWSGMRSGVETFLEALETHGFNPRTSLVTFASSAGLDVQLGSSFDSVTNRINQLSQGPVHGGTNTGAGIDDAIDELLSSRTRSYAAKTIILFSDGRRTVGQSSLIAARRARDNNIVVHTISLLLAGDNEFDQISEITGGERYYASNTQELREAFEELARKVPVMMTK